MVSSDQESRLLEAGGENSFRVGPAPLNGDWFSASSGIVNSRYCLMDDLYAFAENGAFKNVQGELTWLESWQNEGTEACGAPVAPHDGADGASFAYDAQDGEIVITGSGAYLDRLARSMLQVLGIGTRFEEFTPFKTWLVMAL